MSIHRFLLKLISPAFLAGSNKDNPEMHASSIRGQLRYWLRAIIGAETTNLEELRKQESAVFGSTATGSTVSVRVYPRKKIPDDKYAMLPHKSNERDKSYQGALSPEQIWDLEIVTRPGVPMPSEALDALMVWSLLGGIGRRSRRMFGAVEIKPKSGEHIDWYQTPESPDKFINSVKTLMTQIVNYPPHANIPNFPTLNRGYSWVMVCRKPHKTQEEAVKALFGLLRNKDFLPYESTFGYVKPKRRASPLIAQVRRIGKDNYYPILTAIKSNPSDHIRWEQLARFMKAAVC